MFAKTHPSGAGAVRKRSNSTSSAASSAIGGANAPTAGVATAPGESSSEIADRPTLKGPQHKPSSPSTPTAQTGAEAGSNDTIGTKGHDMISGNINNNSKNSTLAAESHSQRQQLTYPTQKATNRDTRMAPSTPKASKHGGSTSAGSRLNGPKTDNRRRPQYFTPKRGGGNSRIVHSPLIDAPPTTNPNAQDARLVNPRDRWKAMSELAGSHKQSLEVLDLSNRSLPAQALKFGVPRKTAQSVRDLRYDGNLVGDGDDGNNDLPAFLDIVVQLFPRLQHLSLRNNPCSPGNKRGGASPLRDAKLPTNIGPKLKSKLDAAIDAANREQMRMHRLYIIYRLPDLLSINGQPVSEEDRQLARPLYPSGTPVRKEVWLTKAMAPLTVDVDVDVGVGSSSSSDGLKVAGKNHASNLDPDDDTGSEMIVPSEAGGMAMSSVEVSMTGLVNYVRTENQDEIPADDVASTDQGKRKNTKGGSSNVEFASSSKKTSRALPPPSPFSKQRTFPPPRQSRRSSKAKGGNNAAAKQLWRQRNKRNVNVGSMVDDESDEESSGDDIEDDEDDLMIPKSKSESDSRAKLTRSISNDDLESKSTASSSLANWGGTLGTSAQMD